MNSERATARLPAAATLTVWRAGIASVSALGLLHLASGPALAPSAAGLLGSLTAKDLVAVVAALCCLGRFATGPGRWLAGLLALVAMGVFINSHAPTFRAASLYASATLAGWLLGLAFARALGTGPPAQPSNARVVEAFAASGALAALSATQVASALTKIIRPEAPWFDGWPLRLSVLMDHRVDASGPVSALWQPVVDSVPLALATSWWIFLAELAAIALPFVGPRLRAAIALHLVIVHLSFGVLFGAVLYQAALLLLLFGFNWGQRRTSAVSDVVPPARVDFGFAAPLALAVGLAATLLLVIPAKSGLRQRAPLPDAPALGDAAQPPSESTEPSAGTASRLGPLVVGQDVSPGWRVTALHVSATSAEISVIDSGDRVILFTLCAPDTGCPPSPYDVADGRLNYAGQVPMGEVRAPGRALAKVLSTEAAGDVGKLLKRWVDEAAATSK